METKELQTALKKLSKIVKSKTTLPVLLCVLFHNVDGKLHITANNQECSATIPIDAPGFNLAVPFQEFYNWIQKVKELEVELRVDDDVLYATTETSSCNIKCLDWNLFPYFSIECDTSPFNGDLKLRLQQALASAPSADSAFLALSGVNIISEGSTLKINASNGLEACCINTFAEGLPPFNIVVPINSVSALMQFLGEPVNIGVLNNRDVVIHNEHFFFTSQLIDAPFPDVRRIIPVSFQTEVTVKAKELKTSVDKALVFAFVNFVELNIGTSILVSTTNSNAGAETDVEIVEITGPPVTIGINGSMLTNKLHEGIVKLSLNGPNSPLKLTIEDDEDYVAIIMPMSLKR